MSFHPVKDVIPTDWYNQWPIPREQAIVSAWNVDTKISAAVSWDKTEHKVTQIVVDNERKVYLACPEAIAQIGSLSDCDLSKLTYSVQRFGEHTAWPKFDQARFNPGVNIGVAWIPPTLLTALTPKNWTPGTPLADCNLKALNEDWSIAEESALPKDTVLNLGEDKDPATHLALVQTEEQRKDDKRTIILRNDEVWVEVAEVTTSSTKGLCLVDRGEGKFTLAIEGPIRGFSALGNFKDDVLPLGAVRPQQEPEPVNDGDQRPWALYGVLVLLALLGAVATKKMWRATTECV